jgi:spore maturation protein SpmA
MGCNCKKKMVLEDKYGVKEEESLASKAKRYFWKCAIFLVFIAASFILIPTLVLMAIYQISFKRNPKIVLPKFLGKYMK